LKSEEGLPIRGDTAISHVFSSTTPVPRQFQSEQLGKNLKTASNVLKPVVGVVFAFASYFYIGFLSAILSDITHLENFNHLLMVNVARASETNVLLQIFLDIGKFDFLPTDQLLD